MYTGLLHVHSLFRWILFILLIISIIRSYNGWLNKKPFTPQDKSRNLYTLIFAHLQLLTGLILYVISPLISSALDNMAGAMKDNVLRFWAVEHISMMIISIAFITIGHVLTKKANNDSAKFKKTAIFFTVALVLILFAIPWPFTQSGTGRGWF